MIPQQEFYQYPNEFIPGEGDPIVERLNEAVQHMIDGVEVRMYFDGPSNEGYLIDVRHKLGRLSDGFTHEIVIRRLLPRAPGPDYEHGGRLEWKYLAEDQNFLSSAEEARISLVSTFFLKGELESLAHISQIMVDVDYLSVTGFNYLLDYINHVLGAILGSLCEIRDNRFYPIRYSLKSCHPDGLEDFLSFLERFDRSPTWFRENTEPDIRCSVTDVYIVGSDVN